MTKREERINDLYVARPLPSNAPDFNLTDTQEAKSPVAIDRDPSEIQSPEYRQSREDATREAVVREDVKNESRSAAPPTEEEPSLGWIMFRELIETIVLSLIIFLLMRQVVQNYRIESQSMETNFCEGQFILVNKLAYKLGDPTRGDVVVFHNPSNQNEDYIKRIIGLPGDTVEVRNQQVLINSQPLDEPYLRYKNVDTYGPTVIEPERLFVMGDNRPNSSDSRREGVGQLPQELLVGQAWLRVWPFDRWGLVRHYEIEPGVPLELAGVAPDDVCPLN